MMSEGADRVSGGEVTIIEDTIVDDSNPYGVCGHTKYAGCPPCIHDAYRRGFDAALEYRMNAVVPASDYVRGREDAAKAIHALAYHPKEETMGKLITLKMAIDAARGKETDDDCTFEDCTRVSAARGGEQA